MSICHMALKGYTTYSVFSLNKTIFRVSIDSFLAKKRRKTVTRDQNIGINHQSWFFLPFLRYSNGLHLNIARKLVTTWCASWYTQYNTITVVTLFPQTTINFNREQHGLSLSLYPSLLPIIYMYVYIKNESCNVYTY